MPKKRKTQTKKEELKLEDLNFTPYDEIRASIGKKLGERPRLPADLPKGIWTEQSLRVLSERYLFKDKDGKIVETPEEMCWRVAWEIASADTQWGKGKGEVLETARGYYRLLVTHEFLPNSPTLMNAGTGNKLQYSACFVLPVEDSLVGIFDAVKWQALIHQTGGGTGFSFTRLRAKGSMVKSSKGTASGPVSFMRIFDAATNEVKQGGKRRGANMGILRVDHPDIMEFIHCKEEGGITNFNISVAITDKFMEAYSKDKNYDLIDPKNGEKVGEASARAVFEEIVKGAWTTGDPGLVFIDRMNKSTANPVPSLGPVESTNPCITGDSLIYTESGLVRVEDLYGLNARVKVLTDARLSEKRFNSASVLKTGIKNVYRLVTKEGYEIDLTADHRLMTPNGWKEAGDLTFGQKILISNRKGGFGRLGSLEEGQIMGWLVGDGTLKASSAVLSFFGVEKKELAPQFSNMVYRLVDGMQLLQRDYSTSVKIIKGRNEARVESRRLLRYMLANGFAPGKKLAVPQKVFSGSEDMQRGFLQALFTADGHTAGNPQKGVSVRLTSIKKSLLRDVQRLLLNFGIPSKIYSERRKRGFRELPDGKGGKKSYLCSAYHDLVISKENLWNFAREIGFLISYKNAKLIDSLALYKEGGYRERFETTFEKLVHKGRKWVYDLVEPSTHSFIANGFVVHNCGEQPLYPFDSCNLGSIFLTYFVKEEDGKRRVDWEKLKEATRLSVRFLDGVIEMNPYTLDAIRKTSLAIRRIGLGVGGWADMLVELGIPYESGEALTLAEKVMKTIQNEAETETIELAKERGPFPLWPVSIYKKGQPRRNSTVTTIAPTGSISIIAGASSGIEPLFAIAYQHIVKDKHMDRRLSFVNPMFEEVARKRGFWTDELREKVGQEGVISHIVDIPEDVRALFGTAHEIDPIWHVKVQAVFQKYTENAVSKTINLRHDATVEDVKAAYLTAWETDCKGITIFRDGSKEAQVLNLGVKDAVAESVGPLRDRPTKVSGVTYKLMTPVGSAFVTINQDIGGDPLEVFINVGKAGSDVAAMAEALGRTISTALRFRGSLSPREKAQEIAHQLAGIGGRRSVGFGPNKIRSLPDAISVALSTHYGFKINGNGNHPEATSHVAGAVMAARSSAPAERAQTGLSDPTMASAAYEAASGETNGVYTNGEAANGKTKPAVDLIKTLLPETTKGQNYSADTVEEHGDICPSCGASALVYEEGCSKCYACGHSEC